MVRTPAAWLLALALAAASAPAAPQPRPLVVSSGPDAVSVTIYRDPQRDAGDEMDTDWLEGFALITETRTVALTAGESELRFEGVAGGIIPASAIVIGLPGGVGEKNRDARLLSPGTLVDAALGRKVHIRRTSRATGAVTESEAIIRAGPDGVVLQTPDGIEALRCTGLPETLLYDRVPEGLSDRPTLAVTTRSAEAVTATVRLSYLADGFDWQANYVIQAAADGRTLDLFAWLTLANSNDESFAQANTQAVAGTLNRDDDAEDMEPAPVSSEIRLQCWPQGTTSDPAVPPPSPPPEMDEYAYASDGDIVVTGSLIREALLASSAPVTVISAEQEELGDLKLYRIPEPVTVAANAQKQVALLRREKVPFQRLYTASVWARSTRDAEPAAIMLRMKNVDGRGLGLPLPQGGVAVFEDHGGRPMLVGEGAMADTAVGEDVEIVIGESAEVQVVQRLAGGRDGDDIDYDRPQRFEIEISNANPRPVEVETYLRVAHNFEIVRPSRKLKIKKGRRMWQARIGANDRAVLAYTIRPLASPDRDEDDDEDEDEEDD
jgi:hypothetical protein